MPTSLAANAQVNSLQLNRLLQLCSANLPVGGFSFSQGLEYAVEMAWVKDATSSAQWIELNLMQSIARTDLALMARLYNALTQQNPESFSQWNQHLLACRESSELLLADTAMGKAMVRLIAQLDAINSDELQPYLQQPRISFVTAFTVAAFAFDIDLISAQSGYCWTFIDNQVAASTKLVPLGQTQAQNLLFALSEKVSEALILANQLSDDEIGASLPRLAMASAWHETQYTRLFRS